MTFHRDRAAEFMRRYQLDALVATSPVNITYFSDYHCWVDPVFKEYMMQPGGSSDRMQSYAVFPLEGKPALVVDPVFAVNATDSWVQDLHTGGKPGLDQSMSPTAASELDQRLRDVFQKSEPNATSTDALVNILKTRALTDARIGLEMEGLPARTNAAIREALPKATFLDCTSLIRLIRMVKSAEELSRLTRSAQIAEEAAEKSLALARVGVPIDELVQQYRASVAEQGAEFEHFAFSVRGWGIATEPSYVLTDEDCLYVDFGCIYKHYYSDAGVTLATGPLPAAIAERYAALRECVEAGVSAIRPGVRASAIQSAMKGILSQRGIDVSFPHGHGIGLELRDYPILVPDNQLRIRDDCVDEQSDLLLEANMAINLEAPLFMPGVGGLQIEQTFVVTESGCRPLITQNRQQPFMPNSTNPGSST